MDTEKRTKGRINDYMKNWIIKNLVNIGLFITFAITFVLLIFSILKIITLPSYGFIILPIILVAVIIIAKGDLSLKIGDLLEIKKDMGTIKGELVTLNTKISNINTLQNITYNYYGNPGVAKETNQIESQTDLNKTNVVSEPSLTEVQNMDSTSK
ncbi:MAG: hypothetical protein XD85_0244 [Parcubacteria bacterium 34_609]|nr:MAG: hypothetical protein XD85_0244 [Parcubacteria bacterium 34_609]KUK98871.1 MAG: hypothetical protein XE08_0364 [Parcubacteria bacterium 32_520]